MPLLGACTSEEIVDDSVGIIRVGGVTRAAAIDDGMEWLRDALKQGMALNYYQTADAKQQVTLRLEADGTYSLKNAAGIPAKWLGNGAHVFEGTYVPDGLMSEGAPTYADLSHYTATLPATKIAATVGRITIPLQHRLARVVAYVLIDDTMHTKISELHFCNVQTLQSVVDGQPVWQKERKVTPNTLGEQLIEAGVEQAKGFTKAPCYDLIVRPTYTHRDSVMFDESNPTEAAGEKLVNAIDFELKLDNGLEYEKHFEFDLNANNETVVYLHVTPERIDYNSAGSRLWKESSYADDYYGVNNPEHTLSIAGSSWQRAYTNSSADYPITDGERYTKQYVSAADWKEKLSQANKDGACHGDYFILSEDITIDTDEMPENFVFTGHLDGMDHTITLTGQRGYLFAGLDGNYDTPQESDQNAGWQAHVHLEGTTWVPIKGYRAEVLNTKIVGGTLFKEGAEITGHVNNCK